MPLIDHIILYFLQVDDLHDTLDDANYTMSENEKLLSDYRTTNLKRSMELDEVSLLMHMYLVFRCILVSYNNNHFTL